MNQWVDLGKNHHVLIYMDSEGSLKEDVVTFWTAVERKRIGDSVYKIPLDGKEIIEILQINDMFLLGYKQNEIDWNNLSYDVLKDNLYKAQSLSTGYYNFKKHVDSRPDKDSKKDYISIRNFGEGKTGWNTFNPIKVKINSIGKIERI
jgi:CRISPR-associated endonuclease Csn1